MTYPKIVVDVHKIRHNVSLIVEKCENEKIDVAGVTKVFCAEKEILEAYGQGGVKYLADSRIENLKKMTHMPMKKIMLRLPMPTEVDEIVTYADISLNSELKTILALNQAAEKQNIKHQIILMVDLGDLREGVFDDNELIELTREILLMNHIELVGLGTNLTCYGGVIPTGDNLGKLVFLQHQIQQRFNIKLPLLSGGNSSSLYLLGENKIPLGINMLRVGEAFVLGRETTHGQLIDGCYDDAFMLEVQLIEVKEKPSVPIGEIGMDAFGNKPVFKDQGMMIRGIAAIGRQDMELDGLIPVDSDIHIVGGSSDHLILDLTNAQKYCVGDIIRFKLTYSGLLRTFTSVYIKKEYLA